MLYDQSPNEMTQTFHHFLYLDLMLKLAYSVNLCSDTWAIFDMFLHIMFYPKNAAKKLQLYFSSNPKYLAALNTDKLCTVLFAYYSDNITDFWWVNFHVIF